MEMENISFVNRPTIGDIPGCPLLIFGDDKAIDYDLKGKFEIIDD